MSIQSEINRIKTEKENLIIALEEKGIEIAEGATLGDISIDVGETEVGIDTSDATATSSDILSGKTAYVNDEKITGTIATKTSSNLTVSGATVTVPAGYYASNASKSVGTAAQATPSVTINSNGLITATATQSAGYVSAGSKSGTKQLTTQAAKTITPSTSNQTAVASGRYTTGAITVKGDSNLKAENIAEGVSIFGITGTHSGGGSGGGNGITTVTIVNQSSGTIGYYAAYTDPSGKITGTERTSPELSSGNSISFEVLSPSLFAYGILSYGGIVQGVGYTGNCEIIGTYGTSITGAIKINGDTTITAMGGSGGSGA